MTLHQHGPDHVVLETRALDATGREWLAESPASGENPILHLMVLVACGAVAGAFYQWTQVLLGVAVCSSALFGWAMMNEWARGTNSLGSTAADLGARLIEMVELDYRWLRRRLAWRRRRLEVQGHRIRWCGRDVDPTGLVITDQRFELGSVGVFVVERPLTRSETRLLQAAIRTARGLAASRAGGSVPPELDRLREGRGP